MKIVVVSDTHHQTQFIEKIPEIEEADLYLHAGDSGLSDSVLFPFQTVMGNCDYMDHDMLLTEYTPVGKILMKHTPYRDSDIDKYKESGYKFFIHGHTHARKWEEGDNIVIINPGSLYYPRDGLSGCYLVIDIDDNTGEVTHEFKTLE